VALHTTDTFHSTTADKYPFTSEVWVGKVHSGEREPGEYANASTALL